MWAVIFIASLVGLFLQIKQGVQIDNNVMHLLPSLSNDKVLSDALERGKNSIASKEIMLVGGVNKQQIDVAADAVESEISKAGFFSIKFRDMSIEKKIAVGTFYYPWRAMLLSDEMRDQIKNQQWAGVESNFLQALYNPLSGISSQLLKNDPLLTFYYFLHNLSPKKNHIEIHDGHMVVNEGNNYYRVILVDINADIFNMDFHAQYKKWRENIYKKLAKNYPDTQLLLMGSVQHAVWGTDSAQNEISLIGNGGMLGIILLIIGIFRRIKILLISMLPLLSGTLSAIVIILFFFKEIHIVTLIFGSSVIGVATDYSFHYLADHLGGGATWRANDCRRRIFPGITLGMLTSVIAYAAIGFAPFPVLRQIAVFSSVGLWVAWLTVVGIFPLLLSQPYAVSKENHSIGILSFCKKLDHQFRAIYEKRPIKIVILLIVIGMLPGVANIKSNDDLRLLQAHNADLIKIDDQVEKLTGFTSGGNFFLVEGDTPEQLQQRDEVLTASIKKSNPSIMVNHLASYLPSIKQQTENKQLLETMITNSNYMNDLQKSISFSSGTYSNALSDFLKTPSSFLEINQFKASPLSELLQDFQWHQTTRGYIAAVLVDNVVNEEALRVYARDHEGVHWINIVSDISELFKHYRHKASGWVAFAYTVIVGLLLYRYGVRRALSVLMAPTLAAWITFGLLGYAAVEINLFHVLALLLVLGAGIDYSIFFAESGEYRDTAMLAILLSALTTLLSFGLLALSNTEGVHAFGLVVCLGISSAVIFSPLAQQHPNIKNRV